MMMSSRADYLKDQLINHCSLFFSDEARDIFRRSKIVFAKYADAAETRESCIAIPTDIGITGEITDHYTVQFNNTVLTLWNHVPRPEGDGWTTIPDAEHALWHRHNSGALIPAWNIFGNLYNLLTLREEEDEAGRDDHGRFIAAFSSRAKKNLLEVPAFNEAAAVMVAAAVGQKYDNFPRLNLGRYIKPPVIVLSHDCDILLGNDIWTQSVRAYRIIRPLFHLRFPRFQNIWWILRNAALPKRFYINNVSGMIDMERIFGCRSTFYLLNGSGGRYGARSGETVLKELIEIIPEGWEIGIHYNYDTFLDGSRFSAQQNELANIIGRPASTGRAHYLRFDPVKSLPFLAAHNIAIDESVGFPDRIGYRCGIGGIFQAFDHFTGKRLEIWEMPMVIMEATLLEQYGRRSIDTFERMMRHLTMVGGAISLIVHPGMFFNPEFPEALGFYHNILRISRDLGAESSSARALLERIKR